MSYHDLPAPYHGRTTSPPPADLIYVGFHAARGMYQYRDGSGRLWEGHQSDVYGTLHAVEEAPGSPALTSPALTTSPPWSPAPSSLQSPTFPTSSSTFSPTGAPTGGLASPPPMTHFPDTWDPPAGYEVDDLPASKRIAHKLGAFRRNRNNTARSNNTKDEAAPLPPTQMPLAVPPLRADTWAAPHRPTTLERGPSMASSTFSQPASDVSSATNGTGAIPRRSTGGGFFSFKRR